jgi:hypothetical protein
MHGSNVLKCVNFGKYINSISRYKLRCLYVIKWGDDYE